MEQLSSWVKNLIFIILFAALLEMFLPEGRMRKYVKVVIGFFVLSIFIMPLTTVLRGEGLTIYPFLPDNLDLNQWEEIKTKGEVVEKANRELIKNYYSQRIKDRIQEVIELDFPDQSKEINLTLNDEYQLTYLQIILGSPGNIDRVEIEPVRIGGGEEVSEPAATKSEAVPLQNLKKKIAQLFLLPLNHIEIKYQEGRE